MFKSFRKLENRQFYVVVIIAKAPTKSTVDSPPPPPLDTHTHAHPAMPHERLEQPSNRAKRGEKKERREGENTGTGE